MHNRSSDTLLAAACTLFLVSLLATQLVRTPSKDVALESSNVAALPLATVEEDVLGENKLSKKEP